MNKYENNDKVADEVNEKIDDINDSDESVFIVSKKMKFILMVLVVIIFISTLIIAFSYTGKSKAKDVDVAQTNAELKDNESLSISIDKKFIDINEELRVEVKSKLIDSQEIKWMSSDSNIVSISDGKITGLSVGKAKIFATVEDIKSNEIEIECLNKIDSIVVDKLETKIEVGKTDTINIKIIPEDATYKEFTWISSDENIAKVENGVITAINIGKCEITATDYTKEITTKCKVEVIPVEIQSVSLDENNVSLGKGQKYILYATYLPREATNTEITWSSTDSNVIKVDNGKITAVNIGTATVTITAINGVKATCNFTVTSNNQTGEVKYAQNQYNIRSGPGTEYEKIALINKNDEIQVVKTLNGWSKIRTVDGTVGFIVSDGYSSSRSYEISGVPYINQFNLGYPTGCEAVSATMAAQYSGYNVSVDTIIANTPTDDRGIWKETITVQISRAKEVIFSIQESYVEENNANVIFDGSIDNVVENSVNNDVNNTTNNTINNNISNDVTNNKVSNNTESEVKPDVEIPKVETKEVIYGGNPFEVFVGHPTKKLNEGSYGCFAAPIVTALKSSGVPCTNISNCSQEDLLGYIRQGKPVIVWCVKNAGDLIIEETWQYPDGSGSFTKLKGEHCAVLIGYDDEYVYLNDPSAGNNVKQPRDKFFSNWKQLYSQAIIIN